MRTLEQQITEAELKLNRLKEAQRKKDTQVKIIVGALVLSAVKDDITLAERIQKLLTDKTAEKDRKKIEELLEELRKITNRY